MGLFNRAPRVPATKEEVDAALFFERAPNTVIETLTDLNSSQRLAPDEQRTALLRAMRTWQSLLQELEQRKCPAGMEDMWAPFSRALQILNGMADTLIRLYEDPAAVARMEAMRQAVLGGAKIDPRQQEDVQVYQSTMRRLSEYNRELEFAQRGWKQWSKNRIVTVS